MIDLHVHTNHSDGTDSLEELLKNAEKAKLEVISITDHDSIDAYFELEKNQELRNIYQGEIIVGTELRAMYKKTNIEILGYGIDYHKLHILEVDQFLIQEKMLKHFKQVADKLGVRYEKDVEVKRNDPKNFYASHTFARSVLKFEENNQIFEKMGLMFKVEEFYRVHESNIKSPFYIDNSEYYPNLDTVVEDIHKAGGLAFLAHAYVYPFENYTEVITEILRDTKIDGAECEYPTFSEMQRKEIKKLCDEFGKFKSGGSDYHAKNKPNIMLGTGINGNLNISKDLIKDWIDKVQTI